MSEPIIEYRDEFNVMDFVSKYAERVSRVIDEQTLASVVHQLARYGYVKVVRCRDCESYQPGMYKHFTCEVLQRWAKPDDFCAWGERKERIEQ